MKRWNLCREWVGVALATAVIPLSAQGGAADGKADWAPKVGGYYLTTITNPEPFASVDTRVAGKQVKLIAIVIEGDIRYILAAVTCRLGRQKVHD